MVKKTALRYQLHVVGADDAWLEYVAEVGGDVDTELVSIDLHHRTSVIPATVAVPRATRRRQIQRRLVVA